MTDLQNRLWRLEAGSAKRHQVGNGRTTPYYLEIVAADELSGHGVEAECAKRDQSGWDLPVILLCVRLGARVAQSASCHQNETIRPVRTRSILCFLAAARVRSKGRGAIVRTSRHDCKLGRNSDLNHGPLRRWSDGGGTIAPKPGHRVRCAIPPFPLSMVTHL